MRPELCGGVRIEDDGLDGCLGEQTLEGGEQRSGKTRAEENKDCLVFGCGASTAISDSIPDACFGVAGRHTQTQQSNDGRSLDLEPDELLLAVQFEDRGQPTIPAQPSAMVHEPDSMATHTGITGAISRSLMVMSFLTLLPTSECLMEPKSLRTESASRCPWQTEALMSNQACLKDAGRGIVEPGFAVMTI